MPTADGRKSRAIGNVQYILHAFPVFNVPLDEIVNTRESDGVTSHISAY